MKKSIIGVVLGAAVFFVWGMVYWMFIPIMNSTIDKLPEERLIMDTLKVTVDKPGLYMFPSLETSEGRMEEKAWAKLYEAGPTGFLVFHPGGKAPMSSGQMIVALLIALLASGFTLFILKLSSSCYKTYASRVLLSVELGVFAAFMAHVPYWNWYNFPTDYTLASGFYLICGFLLIGLIEARFVGNPQ